MNNIVFSTRNIDDFITDVANEVVKKIDLWNVKPQQTTEQADQLLTIDEAGELLHLTKPTLYSKVSKGELPGVCKQGKRLYFQKQSLIDWIKSSQRKSNAEIEAEAESYLKKKGGNNE